MMFMKTLSFLEHFKYTTFLPFFMLKESKIYCLVQNFKNKKKLWGWVFFSCV